MSSIKRGWIAAAVLVTAMAGSQLIPVPALADPAADAQSDVQASPGDEVLHNITYRARVDGVSRGATITYAAEGGQTQTANPTMLPGRTFEAMTVLPQSAVANMRVSIQWPYSANLHCEILVDDAVVAQADDFISPRFLPQKDDPDYGALTCEAPVSGVPNTVPPDPNAAPAEAPPPAAEPAPPVA